MLSNNQTFRRFSTLGLLAGLLALGACGGGSKEAQKEDSLIASLLDESSDSLEAQSLDDKAIYKMSGINLKYAMAIDGVGPVKGEIDYLFNVPGDASARGKFDVSETLKGKSRYWYELAADMLLPVAGLRVNPQETDKVDQKRVVLSAAMDTQTQSGPRAMIVVKNEASSALNLMSIFTKDNAVKSPKGRTYYRAELNGQTVEGFVTTRDQPDLVYYFFIRNSRGISKLIKITAQK